TFRWKGRYDFDLNTDKTLKTELNVFQTFKPKLTATQARSRVVFLANIDPDIQQATLAQVRKPVLTACDTMNYWIESKKPSLLRLLRKVDVALCNDAEARELSGEFNLLKAARWILARGPKLLVIKKGEHGVLCFSSRYIFSAPAFLLEKIFDPTGAGDSFAGGFIGYLARSPRFNEAAVRRAVVYGSVLASYNVESFSLNRVASLKAADIDSRYRLFRRMTSF
ncbi:MAG TPA: PfkB family carbohydrate kinase, partial [Candidatus Eisenbacteria bacterium]|nr:PfkB family carbohydrate kinase [Candidatus Eisenbacteria bacterium]